MSWSGELVDHLCDLKRAGYGFDAAWRTAIKAHPPEQTRRAAEPTNLFEVAAPEFEPLEDFLRRACADAWAGRRPELARLPALMEDEVFPVAVTRHAMGRSRKAAA